MLFRSGSAALSYAPCVVREGDRFGNYLLKQKIAQGGMAAIFRAERVGAMGISREVCIKCILPAHTGDAEFVRMFIDEARISVELSHSNVAQIFDLGKVEDHYFIASAMVYPDAEDELVFEQVSFFLGERYLITVQEDSGRDVFEKIRERLRVEIGRAHV